MAIEKDVEIVVLLKHLGNFWNSLNIPLVNCGVSLILTWSENCVLTRKTYRRAVAAVDEVTNPTGAAFIITNCKLYVPIVTLSP